MSECMVCRKEIDEATDDWVMINCQVIRGDDEDRRERTHLLCFQQNVEQVFEMWLSPEMPPEQMVIGP